MNGELAQCVIRTSYGNAYLQVLVPSFDGSFQTRTDRAPVAPKPVEPLPNEGQDFRTNPLLVATQLRQNALLTK